MMLTFFRSICRLVIISGLANVAWPSISAAEVEQEVRVQADGNPVAPVATNSYLTLVAEVAIGAGPEGYFLPTFFAPEAGYGVHVQGAASATGWVLPWLGVGVQSTFRGGGAHDGKNFFSDDYLNVSGWGHTHEGILALRLALGPGALLIQAGGGLGYNEVKRVEHNAENVFAGLARVSLQGSPYCWLEGKCPPEAPVPTTTETKTSSLHPVASLGLAYQYTFKNALGLRAGVRAQTLAFEDVVVTGTLGITFDIGSRQQPITKVPGP